MASRKMQLNLNIEELPNIKKRIADLTAERDAAVARAEAAEQALQRVRAETAEAIAQAIEAARDEAVERAGVKPNWQTPEGRVVRFTEEWLTEAASIAREHAATEDPRP